MYSPPPDEAAEALARDPIDPVEATERFLEDAAADADEPGKDEILSALRELRTYGVWLAHIDAKPEAWRDAPLARLLAAVDAWEIANRRKSKRRRRPVHARSARCEDLEGYNLDHLSVYEAIEASGGCVVLR